jgi:hypothetical protein
LFRPRRAAIHVRAIVEDDGATEAAIVVWELIFVPADRGGSQDSRRDLMPATMHDHGRASPP